MGSGEKVVIIQDKKLKDGGQLKNMTLRYVLGLESALSAYHANKGKNMLALIHLQVVTKWEEDEKD